LEFSKSAMNVKEQKRWFDSLKNKLEQSYIHHKEPWKQSGFSGPEDRWVKCRKPIANCIETSGTFLDIGCANGYLLECILKWTRERNLNIIPFGLDLSEKLIDLAKERLPEYSENFFIGNAWEWNNPMRFDYVRTEIVYVPECLGKQYIERITNLYLKKNGILLVTEYRSRREDINKPWIDKKFSDWGFKSAGRLSGFYDNKELTRVLVLHKE